MIQQIKQKQWRNKNNILKGVCGTNKSFTVSLKHACYNTNNYSSALNHSAARKQAYILKIQAQMFIVFLVSAES